MRRIAHKIGLLVMVTLLAISMVLLGACEDSPTGSQPVKFGFFSCGKNSLYTFSTRTLDYTAAKTLVETKAQNRINTGILTTEYNSSPADALIDEYLAKYRSIVITSYFWQTVEGEAVKKEISSEILGTELQSILKRNEIIISTGIVVSNILVFPDIVDYYEAQNEEYRAEKSLLSPFNSKYTYHQSQTEFVLQQHAFVEIPSSVGGGISCSFIQENESLYDSDLKMTNFQSSLGMQMQTPAGTQYEGTILEVTITWNPKSN